MDRPPFKKTFSQSDFGIRCLNDIVYGRAIQQFLKNRMGGAMELAQGAKKVVVVMSHTDQKGRPKLVESCSLPLTAAGCADLIITHRPAHSGHFFPRHEPIGEITCPADLERA
jgi:hypothetical protein